MANNTIRLSPLVRLRMTFGAEANLDETGVYGRETYENYLEMQRDSDAKLQRMIKSLYVTDIMLFLLSSGQKWKLPVVDVEISSIPAIQEILLFSAALGFFMLCAMFVTNQCYLAIIDEFGNRIVDSSRMDPDFFNASRKPFDFFLKVFSPKLNHWGIDLLEHKTPFAIFTRILKIIIILVVLSFPFAHLVLTWVASLNILYSDLSIYGKGFILSAVGLINTGGVLLVLGLNWNFTFKFVEPPQEQDIAKSDQS